MTMLPQAIYSRMSREEHRHLKYLRDKFVEAVEMVARKMVFNTPEAIHIYELQRKRDTYQEMIEVFQQEMIERHTLKPLVTTHLTPGPEKK